MDEATAAATVAEMARVNAENQRLGALLLAMSERAPRPKANTPEEFEPSRRTDVDTWLFTVHSYFKFFPNLTSAERADNAATYLKGSAVIWWRHYSESAAYTTSTDKWTTFVNAMRQKWLAVNPVRAARDKIHNLRQITSVDDYTRRFLDLRIRISDMTDAEASDRYVRGLKQAIRVECLKAAAEASPTAPVSLDTFIRIADSMDSIIESGFGERRVGFRKFTPRGDGPAPMDISALGVDDATINDGDGYSENGHESEGD